MRVRLTRYYTPDNGFGVKLQPLSGPHCYHTTSSSIPRSPPNSNRKRGGHSDSIRSKGLAKDHEFNVTWLCAGRRVLKPEGTLWVTGTHHIVFSLGFALQRLGYRIINQIAWSKPTWSPTLFTPHSLTRRR